VRRRAHEVISRYIMTSSCFPTFHHGYPGVVAVAHWSVGFTTGSSYALTEYFSLIGNLARNALEDVVNVMLTPNMHHCMIYDLDRRRLELHEASESPAVSFCFYLFHWKVA